MNIRFINHASFILEFNGVRIIHDPWLFGSAFNNGWDLLCNSPLEMEEFRHINYIWFSHEHPDHFSPPVLKSIPEETRRGITVLFQKTRDRKVIDFCAKLGFQTQELPHEKPVQLADGIEVICGNVPFFDSWILYNCNGTRILNINDCVVDGDGNAEDIRNVTGEVDLLFTQFSYAAWKGNPADKALREDSARSKLEIMGRQIKVFKPKWTIPFASFVYFSHEENRYNNDSINTPHDAVTAIAEAGSQPVLLYPGDVWEVGDAWDNQPALEKYQSDYELSGKPFHTAGTVSEAGLMESARKYVERIRSRNNSFLIGLIRRIPGLGFFQPLNLFVYDLGSVYQFSFTRGLVKVEASSAYDVRMHSENLDYIFRFDWGYDTLTVNGRFEADMNGFGKMTKLFAIGPLNNTGRFINSRLLFDVRVITSFLRALRKFMRRLRAHGV
ncbi:MAG: MBL fold metallo-hydrolase [Candidatus Kapaibacterium sp.]